MVIKRKPKENIICQYSYGLFQKYIDKPISIPQKKKKPVKISL